MLRVIFEFHFPAGTVRHVLRNQRARFAGSLVTKVGAFVIAAQQPATALVAATKFANSLVLRDALHFTRLLAAVTICENHKTLTKLFHFLLGKKKNLPCLILTSHGGQALL